MLCFRCGSPIEGGQVECPNCGQALEGEATLDDAEVDALKEQLRRGARPADGATYRRGEVIQGRYEVLDVIGEGPLGIVYKAHDKEIDVDVAVKVMAGEYLPDDDARESFVERVSALRKVVHTNVVRYFDVSVDGERCYCVMQFLEGLSLRKIIDLRKEKGQRFSLAEVEPIISQIADALVETESCHGGLKPQNVIILPNLLKMTDVGLATALPRDSYLAGQRGVEGADLYIAPEVRQGGPCGPSADVYSLGVIVTELLTGKPSAGQKPRIAELDPEFPLALDDVLERAVAEDPADRYATVAELKVAYGQLIESTEVVAGEGHKEKARHTLPYGSPVLSPKEEALGDTLRYGQVRPEDERTTLRVTPDEGEEVTEIAAKQPKEVTQQLDLEDVEMEEDSEELSPPTEGTQQLSLEDVEFASGMMPLEDEPEEAEKDALEQRHAEEVTVPRAIAPAAVEEAFGELDDRETLRVGQEDEGDEVVATNELPLPATRESDGDYAAVSGETDSSSRPIVARKTDEDLRIPRRERADAQEARARNVLQAFDVTEGTGRFEEMIEPAEEVLLDEEQSEEAAFDALPMAAVVQTRAAQKASRIPLIVAVAAGIIFGSVFVLLVAGRDEGKGEKVATRSVAASDVEKTASAPKVSEPKLTSLASAADSGATQRDARGAPAAARADASPAPDVAAQAPDVAPAKVAPKESPKKEIVKVVRDQRRPRREKARVEARKVAAKKKVKVAGEKKSKKHVKVAKEAKKSGSKCPAGMAHIRPRGSGDGYCIDRYEAPRRGRKPRTLSYGAAKAACRARGARLCTSKEWMRSCGGLFPYGRSYDASRCNTEGKGKVAAGSKRGCRSPYGVYDLSGNVAEWVEGGAAMGGHYGSAQGHASCTARTSGGANTGYRCCADIAWEF